MTDLDSQRARALGINHVALEVGDVEAALEFYEELFEFDIRGRSESAVFLDMGDQFLALSEATGAADRTDDHRHFGLVVDDMDAVERRLEALDVERLPDRHREFRDPWGNRIQIVAYSEIQFTKVDHVLRGMGVSPTQKTEDALAELDAKGMASE